MILLSSLSSCLIENAWGAATPTQLLCGNSSRRFSSLFSSFRVSFLLFSPASPHLLFSWFSFRFYRLMHTQNPLLQQRQQEKQKRADSWREEESWRKRLLFSSSYSNSLFSLPSHFMLFRVVSFYCCSFSPPSILMCCCRRISITSITSSLLSFPILLFQQILEEKHFVDFYLAFQSDSNLLALFLPKYTKVMMMKNTQNI